MLLHDPSRNIRFNIRKVFKYYLVQHYRLSSIKNTILTILPIPHCIDIIDVNK